ncbi:SGNH/GDSL hydrolase family protein [Pseudenhygromyxa sp. WMMC2535]|uniref:SGNH/GDSL hydrolase family protein n=1 Tax=Pseudenhygromyxa sp. WMMC2535 TaxID=2712867 RepID=UPI001557CFA4|nr:SGNH/GDSL hydrolase family protein [Pseudenhygromyxa sp. WMMC2535]NVB38949.1 SGNH/GDSL hydrolase family protein [Pseudenhygromyxa sp. WMMC2535]
MAAEMNLFRSTLSSPTLLFLLAPFIVAGCGADPEPGSSDEAEDTGTDESGETGTDETTTDESGSGESSEDDVGESTEESTETGTETDTETDSDTGETDTGGDNLACLDGQFLNGPSPGPAYGAYDLTIGSHCNGTNNQDITDIERVVFLGDSVTVGTPPTGVNEFYRSLVADELEMAFDLDATNFLWKQYDPVNGTAVVQDAGDFSSCAKWGARNDDFLGNQLEDCFPEEERLKRTLVITTMGGNDIAALAKDAVEGVTTDALLADADSMLADLRMGMEWMMDPEKFPNGIFVVFANVYEFTDATADLLSCPAASVAGFDANPEDPDQLMELINYINGEYAQVAADFGTDLVFMFENFCGHGFRADDTSGLCYRGPSSDTWFDLTCIHPTPDGHAALAGLFLDVILE